MALSKMELGRKGEDVALQHLKKNKFKLLIANYRNDFGEIDLIVSKKRELHFVEVKTRSSVEFGHPEEAVTAKKQAKIKQVAQVFLSDPMNRKYQDFDIYLDVISVMCDEYVAAFDVKHLINAF